MEVGVLLWVAVLLVVPEVVAEVFKELVLEADTELVAVEVDVDAVEKNEADVNNGM